MRVEAQSDETTVAGNWIFDDGSAKDTSRNGLNGNFVGNPKSIKGIVDKALQFDGQNDAVNIPDSPHINTGAVY